MKKISEPDDIGIGGLIIYVSNEEFRGDRVNVARLSEKSETEAVLIPWSWNSSGVSEVTPQEKTPVLFEDLIGGMWVPPDEARHLATLILVAAG